MAELRGVEIGRVGTWNGDHLTRNVLDDLVEVHAENIISPVFVKRGHAEKRAGDPCHGVVRNLRREGDLLLADFAELDSGVVSDIQTGRLTAVSAELFLDGTPCLMGVALLPPDQRSAVRGLAPLQDAILHKGISKMITAECLKTYSGTGRIFIDDNGQIVGSRPGEDAGGALDLLAREYAADHCCDYAEALERCMANPRHADLVAKYAHQQPRPINTAKLYAATDYQPELKSYVGQELDAAAQRVMREFGETNYAAAFDVALELNPSLAARYGAPQ